MKHYDYIMSGAGAAGLSLLKRMMQRHSFNEKKILVIDRARKITNDRTWCFWEKGTGIFEPVVHQKWQQVHFYSNYFSGLLDLSPYGYTLNAVFLHPIVFKHHIDCCNNPNRSKGLKLLQQLT